MEGLELSEWEGAVHGRGQSLWAAEVPGRSATSQRDEAELIQQARAQLLRHKSQKRLSRWGRMRCEAAVAPLALGPRLLAAACRPHVLAGVCSKGTHCEVQLLPDCCRIEKGALADRVLHAGEVPFALRLGALLR